MFLATTLNIVCLCSHQFFRMSVEQSGLAGIRDAAVLVESKDGFPAIYKIEQKVIATGRGVRKVLAGKENSEAKTKRDLNILIVGANGSGKTTLLNGFANYLYSVKFEDPFRYKLVLDTDEAGHTDFVTGYRFDWQPWFPIPYNVVLIDTPGFGYERGPKADEATVKKIEELFESETVGIDSLRAVALVAQANICRLTCVDKYVFDRVQGLFGNDIANNFAVMGTFADAVGDRHVSRAKNAMEKAGIPVREFYRFNNCALFCQNKSGDDNEDEDEDDDLDKTYWKILTTSYRRFFNAIVKFPETSLTRSRDVLQRRQGLSDTLGRLKVKIDEAINILAGQRELKGLLEKYEKEDYVRVKDRKIDIEKSLQRLKDRWDQAWQKAYDYLKEYQASLSELRAIALVSETRWSEVDYLMELIRWEEKRKPDGWEDRKRFCEQALELAKLGTEVAKTTDLKALLSRWFKRLS